MNGIVGVLEGNTKADLFSGFHSNEGNNQMGQIQSGGSLREKILEAESCRLLPSARFCFSAVFGALKLSVHFSVTFCVSLRAAWTVVQNWNTTCNNLFFFFDWLMVQTAEGRTVVSADSEGCASDWITEPPYSYLSCNLILVLIYWSVSATHRQAE